MRCHLANILIWYNYNNDGLLSSLSIYLCDIYPAIPAGFTKIHEDKVV